MAIKSRKERLNFHEARLSELHIGLAKAESLFKDKSIDAGSDNFQREGIVSALMSVQEFLRAEGFESHLRDTIRTLIGALGDIDKGRDNPIFQKEKLENITGRKTIRNDIAAMRGHAAALVSLYMNKGMKLNDAAHKVATALKRHGFVFSNRDDRDQALALINFRKSLLAGRVKNKVARAIYDTVWDCRYQDPNAGDRLLEELVKKIRKVSKPPEI